MDDRSVTRRSLFGALALTTTTAALGSVGINLNSVLNGTEGERKVRAILKKHFELEPVREKTITEFYQSLLLAKDHRKSQEFFLEHLDNKALEERLELYVIEEFVTTTNYMMVLGGEDKELRMLR